MGSLNVERGEDVSRFQKLIDWAELPADRVFAYLGMWDWQNLVVDNQLARNIAEADKTGRAVGGYYRTDPTRWTAEQEARRMLGLLAQHGLDKPGRLIPAVDIEPTGKPGDKVVDWPKWTREFFAAWARLTSLPLLVYSSGSYFTTLLGGTADWPAWVRCWVGHTEKYSSPPGLPAEEWAGRTTYEPERTVVHQYSHTGRIPGITGDVDLDALMPGVSRADITLKASGGHMSVIAPRSAWGPSYSNGATDQNGRAIIIGVSAWRDIFVHHSVTNVPGGASATVAQEIAHMKTLESIGQGSFGQGISYTVIVFPSGRCYQGHDLDRRGAHTYQRNDSARAICFVGNFENEQPTKAAINGACNVLAEWRAAGLPSRVTGGHRDVYPTACPGKNLYAALGQIKAENASTQGEDEMSWDTYIRNHYGSDVQAGEMVAFIDEHLNDANAKLDSLIALVGELAKDPALTPARAEEIVRSAVNASNSAHLAAQKAQLDATLAVVQEIVGARDEDLAAEVVDEIGRRTARPEAA